MQYNIITAGRRNRIAEVDYDSSELDIQYKIWNPSVKRQADVSQATNFLMATKQDEIAYYAERYSKRQKSLVEVKIDYENEHGYDDLHLFATDLVIRSAEVLYLIEHHKIGDTYFHPMNMYGEDVSDLRMGLRSKVEENISYRNQDAINAIKNLFLWALIASPLLEGYDGDYSEGAQNGVNIDFIAMADDREGTKNRTYNSNASAALDEYYNKFIREVDDNGALKPIRSAEDIFHLFYAEKQLEDIKAYAGGAGKEIEEIPEVEPTIDEPVESPKVEPVDPDLNKPKTKHNKSTKKEHEEKRPKRKKKSHWLRNSLIIAALCGAGWLGYNKIQSNKAYQDSAQQINQASNANKIDMNKLKNDMSQGKYSQAADLASNVSDIKQYSEQDQQIIMTALLTDYRYDKVLALSNNKDNAAAQIFMELKSDKQKSAFKNMSASDSIIDGLKKAVDGDMSGLNDISSNTKISDTVAKACAQAYASSDDNDGAKNFVKNHPGAKSAFVKAYKAQNKEDIANEF